MTGKTTDSRYGAAKEVHVGNDRASIQELADAAARVTPTPEGHPLPGEYVTWSDVGSTYTASGTVHDAAFLALAPRVARLAAELLKDFDAPVETWAEVEVLGHRSHVGRVREETLAGVSFLRVDALRADGTFEAVLYGRQAIFSVTPRSEADARRAALPESLRPCDAFEASGACEGACVHCGYDLGAHDAHRAGTRKRDEEKGDDMPW